MLGRSAPIGSPQPPVQYALGVLTSAAPLEHPRVSANKLHADIAQLEQNPRWITLLCGFSQASW
jgi:hypothetical protein